jgi:Rrf2 family iron-sulfur cluster assembly transcriptional regulator
MTFLAQQPPDVLVPAVSMQGKVRVPANYRSKILNQLTRIGLLESTRGRTGGFRLARSAAKIRLSEVIAPFEPVAPAVACLLGQARCSDTRPCGAHHQWRELAQARDAFLRGTTIADVASSAAV